MKKFTNQNVEKEHKKIIRNLIIFLICIGVAIGFEVWAQNLINNAETNIAYLDDIIVSKEEDKTDKKAYLNVANVPYQFAVSDDTTDAYYMLSDGNFLYIAYMSVSDFQKLNQKDIKDNPIRIEGITSETTKVIKDLAIDAYNEDLEDDEKISSADFEDYFGSVYLNTTVNTSSVATIQTCLFFLFLLFGTVGFIGALVELLRIKKTINKMNDSLVEELDNEMNNENSFYYDKARLYLTDKHIINFNGTFTALEYKDIVWMYPYEYRVNGIKTTQAIMVMTNDGKIHKIANIDVVTKAKKEVYNEIWNTIISKNPTITLGYTKENIKEMKETYKKKKNQL